MRRSHDRKERHAKFWGRASVCGCMHVWGAGEGV